ncbi:paraquat-inducible membrane protein A [Rhodanobacter sp. C06]|uniref:paraquat-inducible protein A n=1 Tax=Rhodanobacter sp. C06 TaxID=1945854 RepID=UPI000986E8B5|nr:paraquat-inducible protein A [Rhodanobacter sp. C06]OOG44121.1 paraquat-inducible membrane protein A [Rhodanobacter sp. C06]
MDAPSPRCIDTTAPALLICEHCDTVHRRRPLAKGEVAECARCGAVLERCRGMRANALLALVLTALVVFVQATLWPIVTLGLNGQYVAATLWDVIHMMWLDHSQVVAVLAAATLFVFPLAKILTLGWLLAYARSGRRAPGFRPLMVALHHLGPWTMSEVFVLGALVSIVKAHLYFDVLPDPGIYAYGALMLLITVFAGVDLTRLWDETRDEDAGGAP